MATIDIARKFAEQAIKVDREIQQAGITGNAGRVVLVLTMARTAIGVSQKNVVIGSGLPKDVVSKLVGSLVQAGLLTQVREATDSRMKRLLTSDPGRELLSRVRGALQPLPSANPKSKPQFGNLFENEG
jgi:DNA-binding MarR family transcriptional regulator